MSKHSKMYVTITDIIGEKRMDLADLIRGKEVAVVSGFSDNVQYWLKESVKAQLSTSNEKKLNMSRRWSSAWMNLTTLTT